MYGECIVKTQTFTEGDYIRRGLRENKENVPPHLTLPGKTTSLNGIFRTFKV